MIEERFVAKDGLERLQRLPDFAIADDFFRIRLKCCDCGEVNTLEPYGQIIPICFKCNASLNESYRFVGFYNGCAYYLDNDKAASFDKVFIPVDEIEVHKPKPQKSVKIPKPSMRMSYSEWRDILGLLGVTFVILLIEGKIIQELIEAGLFP